MPEEAFLSPQPSPATAAAAAALGWLAHKEDLELSAMKGQSNSWFFIEELYIGGLSVNITMALSRRWWREWWWRRGGWQSQARRGGVCVFAGLLCMGVMTGLRKWMRAACQ